VRRIVLGLLLLAAALGIVLLSMPRNNAVEIEGFNKLATNIQEPRLIDGSLFFFTGSSFAKLDMSTGETSRLSDYFLTKGQITIGSWSKDSVLFYTSGTGDDVFGRASQNTNSATSDRWWRYDFANKNLQLLDFKGASGCVYVFELSNKLYCFSSVKGSSNSFNLTSYDITSHQHDTLLNIDRPIAAASVWHDRLLYLTQDLSGAQSLNSFNPSDKNSEVIYSSKQQIQYDSNKDFVLINERQIPDIPGNSQPDTESGDKPVKSDLKVLDSSGKVVAKKNIDGRGGQVTGSSNSLVYSNRSGFFYSFDNGALDTYRIGTSELGPVWQINGSTYFLRNDNRLYINKSIQSALKSADLFRETLNGPPNSFYISNQAGDISDIHLNAKGQPFNTATSDVDSFLINNGFDPNQFNFNWTVVNAADPGIEAANVEVLK
jgi:hypothetical protein